MTLQNITQHRFLFLILLLGFFLQAQNPQGELQRWHKVTLDFEGPNTEETATVNPFSDYRLDVTFTHQGSNRSYVVPGFYSACGDAVNNSCDTGNIWRVHFTPDQTGTWNWDVSFVTGTDVAINEGGSSTSFNGDTGSFQITESNKTGKDFRNKDLGRLKYVGEHYLQHIGTDPSNPNGPWFIKAGADAPENTLAYDDFDNTPNKGNRRKSWTPHQQDYVVADASEYTWDGGKGSELLGVVNYLSDKGVNAFSFLTFNVDGDDQNVFPHLLKVSIEEYNNINKSGNDNINNVQWNQGVHKDRFDVSKLAQWENIFSYADKKGMYMHFKTMETENCNNMDNTDSRPNTAEFGRERKLYYRELIARFGHHLALNWNLTEETVIRDEVTIATAAYINSVDPYNNNIVLHTYPGAQNERYTPLLGGQSELTGASIQMSKGNTHNVVKEWVEKSKDADKKWVVANDEQGAAGTGVDVDGKDDKLVRNQVLWGTLMAGGAGVEYYYGYQTQVDGEVDENGNQITQTDLTAEDHRSRDLKYSDAARALVFFNDYLQDDLTDMQSSDDVTSDTEDYVLSKAGEVYAIYRPDGGSTALDLPSGNSNYQVQWYNPRSGNGLTSAETLGGNLVAPNNNDWVALIFASSSGLNSIDIPGIVEAEDYTDEFGIQTETTSDTGGGSNIGFINDGDYTEYVIDVETSGTYEVSARVASASSGGTIVLISDDIPVGEINVSNTEGWQNWVDITTTIDLSEGEQTLRLEFIGDAGNLFNINKLEFTESTTLSVDTADIYELSIYPNPAQDFITVQGIELIEGEATIYDLQGREVISSINISQSESTSIDISRIPSGVYLMKILNNGNPSTLKFIKK